MINQNCETRGDPRARAYAHRRTTEGMSRKEIIRCLKRYVAREVYTALLTPHPLTPDPSSAPTTPLHRAGGVNVQRPQRSEDERR